MQKIIFCFFILSTFLTNKSFSQPSEYFDSANNTDNFIIIGDIDFKNLFDIRLQRFDNESDLKKSKEIIYFYDDYICYLITDMDTHFIVKRKKIYTINKYQPS